MEPSTTHHGLRASDLKIIAMVCMLLDHLWATVVPRNLWMTCVGRIAFPIFAFQIAEGYYKPRDLKAYRKRLLFWAVLTEIPFNLLTGGAIINPFHQNVLWTMLLGLWVIEAIDGLRRTADLKQYMKAAAIVLAALLLSVVGFVDYGAAGVLTVVAFGLLRGQKWEKVGQLLAMGYIHGIMIKGMMIPVGGFDVKVQSFAILALIPIWLYDGRKGIAGKGWRLFSYAFYPLHMLIIGLVARMI